MKINPWTDEVQIKIEKPTVGMLDVSGKPAGIEIGEVIALGCNLKPLGNGYPPLSIGNKILFKSWALDIVNVEGENYFFINVNSKGIKGVVQ